MTMENEVEVKAPKKILSIQDILSKDDTTYKNIDVPEWGGEVRIGTLDSNTMMKFFEDNEDTKKRRIATLSLVLNSIVNENGERLSKNPTSEALEAFGKKNPTVIVKLVEEIQDLNGFNEKTDAVDIRKVIEHAEGDEIKLRSLVAELRSKAIEVEEAIGDASKLLALTKKPKKDSEVKNA